MSTQIKNYDGTVLTELATGILDITSTSLNLPGTGVLNYGGPVLDDLVWIMQHFSRSTAPDHAVKGQIWYDTTGGILKLYNGTNWVASGSIISAATEPAGPVNGTLWWDVGNKLLKLWNGIGWTVIGPAGAGFWTGAANNAPDGNNVHNLGNITNRFNTVYTVNTDSTGISNLAVLNSSAVNVASLTTTATATLASAVVQGSLNSGNIIVLGNISVTSDVIASGNGNFGGAVLVNGNFTAATVGVGTAANGFYKLDVAGPARFTNDIINEYNGPVYQFMRDDAAPLDSKMWVKAVDDNGTYSEYIIDDANNPLHINYVTQTTRTGIVVGNTTVYGSNNIPALVIQGNGNISIPVANRGIVFQDGSFQKSAGSASIGQNGWQILPSGLMLQWGVVQITVPGTSSTYSGSITFARAFSSAPFIVTGTPQTTASGAWTELTCQIASYTTTGASVFGGTASSGQDVTNNPEISWYAIGQA
jgi:hypothetical protein